MSYRTPGGWPGWPPQTGGFAPAQPGVPRPAPAPNPGLRASTADRQRYTDYISMAYAAGQLDEAEMSARLDRALRAKTIGELDPIVADLNFASMAPTGQAVAPVQPVAAPVRKKRRHPIAKAVTALIVAGVLIWGVGTAGHLVGLWNWQPDPEIGAGQGVGSHTYSYTNLSQLDDLSIDVGNSVVDFSNLNLTRDASMSIEQDTGALHINLPADANVVVHYTTDVGAVTINGGSDSRTQGGVGAEGTATWTSDPGGPTLTLEVEMDTGSLTVN